MNNIFLNVKNYILRHKIISLAVLVILIVAGYQIIKSSNNSSTQITYTAGKVTKGTLVSTVSGTGQVSASSQVDLKTQTSGNISYLNLKVGQDVYAGSVIAQIDSANAAFELENAKLAYDKLVTIDPDTLRKDENAVTSAAANLESSYTAARTSMVSDLTDMTDVSTGLSALFDFNTGYLTDGNYLLNSTAKDYQTKAMNSFGSFNLLLTSLTSRYKNISGNAGNNDTDSLISDFKNISLAGAQASKDAQDAVIYLRNNQTGKSSSRADAAYSSIVNLVSKANNAVADMSSLANSVANNKISLENAAADLKTLKDGPDTLSLRQAQLTVSQKQDALANYSVTAPFTGVIASAASINIGDTVGSGTTVATLITKQKVAEISLNEIDAAKVKVGQKVNLTFDAIDGLNITGTVAEVDLIGTVSQGVVSYSVKISFDTQDDRVKSGMSVSSSIITEAKTDVLMVPASAIKTQGNTYYVDIPGVTNTDIPTQQTVTIGSSNDTSTEIISGLKEGDSIVVKTTTGTATTKTANTASISSLLSGNRGGGRAGN